MFRVKPHIHFCSLPIKFKEKGYAGLSLVRSRDSQEFG